MRGPLWSAGTRPRTPKGSSQYKGPLLVQELQAKNLLENRSQNAIATIGIATILVTTVVAILITAAETLAEVVLVVFEVNIVTIVAIAAVLVGESLFRTETPAILPVRLASQIAL